VDVAVFLCGFYPEIAEGSCCDKRRYHARAGLLYPNWTAAVITRSEQPELQRTQMICSKLFGYCSWQRIESR